MDIAPVFHPARSKYLVFTADYLLPFFICIAILILGYFTLFSSFFKINNVECSLDYQACTDLSLLTELDSLKGQNIFKISTPSIVKKLTSGDFTIREAHLRRELPNIIKVELQSVYPSVALAIVGDPTWVILDSTFRVIGTRLEDPNVPTVEVTGPLTLTIGKRIGNSDIISTLELALRLSEELFSVRLISLIDQDTIKLTLSDGKIAIFTPKKDELVQLRALQAILSDDTITKGVKTIDVRFSQPVLR